MRVLGYLLYLILILLCSCAPVIQQQAGKFAGLVNAGETVAVTAIYNETNGNVTALGNRWRDDIEAALTSEHIAIKARRDIGVIIDDIDSFGNGSDEQKIWVAAGADLLVSGSYRLHANAKTPHATLTIKLLDVHNANIRKTLVLQKPLLPGWSRSETTIYGNQFSEAVEIVADNSTTGNKPHLLARLDRQPACYPSGYSGKVLVTSEIGTHIYLLNLAADQSVTLIYPNSRLPDQPISSRLFEFPPKALAEEMSLVFYPLQQGQMCSESIKVISSYYPIDFSYLPIPEDTIYAGATGGNIKKVLNTLKNARGWSEQVLSYMVGPDCRE